MLHSTSGIRKINRGRRAGRRGKGSGGGGGSSSSYEKMMKTILLQNQQIIIQQQNMMFMVIKQSQSQSQPSQPLRLQPPPTGAAVSTSANQPHHHHQHHEQQPSPGPSSQQNQQHHNNNNHQQHSNNPQQQQPQHQTQHQQQQQYSQSTQQQPQPLQQQHNQQQLNQQHHDNQQSQQQHLYSHHDAGTSVTSLETQQHLQQVAAQLQENLGTNYLTPAASEQDPISDKPEDEDFAAFLEGDGLLTNNLLYNPQTDIGSVTPYKNNSHQHQTPSYYSSGCESLTTPRVEQPRQPTTTNISQNVVKNLADSFKSPTKPKINVQILSGSATRNMKNSKAKIIQSMNISAFLRHVHQDEGQKSATQ